MFVLGSLDVRLLKKIITRLVYIIPNSALIRELTLSRLLSFEERRTLYYIDTGTRMYVIREIIQNFDERKLGKFLGIVDKILPNDDKIGEEEKNSKYSN